MSDPTDYGTKTDTPRLFTQHCDRAVDGVTARIIKEIEDDVRAMHPDMTDEQIRDLHASHPLRGADAPNPGYVYCPYIPVYVIDCRPWWQGIFHWSWWRTIARELSIVRWWKQRRLMKRYALRRVDPTLYQHVSVGGTGTVDSDGVVRDFQLITEVLWKRGYRLPKAKKKHDPDS